MRVAWRTSSGRRTAMLARLLEEVVLAFSTAPA
jgi:hypothetical protein